MAKAIAVARDPLKFLGRGRRWRRLVTCSSAHSRNRLVGEELATSRTLAEIRRAWRSVAEGVETAPAVLDLAVAHDVEMPIAEAVVDPLRGAIERPDLRQPSWGDP